LLLLRDRRWAVPRGRGCLRAADVPAASCSQLQRHRGLAEATDRAARLSSPGRAVPAVGLPGCAPTGRSCRGSWRGTQRPSIRGGRRPTSWSDRSPRQVLRVVYRRATDQGLARGAARCPPDRRRRCASPPDPGRRCGRGPPGPRWAQTRRGHGGGPRAGRGRPVARGHDAARVAWAPRPGVVWASCALLTRSRMPIVSEIGLRRT
jgi:hypothetical protein